MFSLDGLEQVFGGEVFRIMNFGISIVTTDVLPLVGWGNELSRLVLRTLAERRWWQDAFELLVPEEREKALHELSLSFAFDIRVCE